VQVGLALPSKARDSIPDHPPPDPAARRHPAPGDRADGLSVRQRPRDNGQTIGDRWSIREDEVAREYACDRFVDRPALRAWRGVTVEAPAERVWPWIAQIRVAPYSYDWIDNGFRRSPQTLTDPSEPQVGEAFTTCAGRKLGSILAVDPGVQLTGRIMGGYASYLLLPESPDRTRLLLKVVMQTNRLLATGLSLGDLLMARRQLLNLKRLTESQQ
jgi:hypothetical protein